MVKKTDKNRRNVRITYPTSSTTTLVLPLQVSRQGFYDTYAAAVAEALETRKGYQITMTDGDVNENLTPPLLEDTSFKTKLLELNEKIKKHSIPITEQLDGIAKRHQSIGISGKNSLENILPGMDALDSEDDTDNEKNISVQEPARVLPFIKIVLRRSDELVLFEQRSNTVPRDSDEARKVEDDNKFYDYITVGKGRVRRTTTSEAQTIDVLYKSRDVNTERIEKAAVVSYVSNFEMFDTYKNLETTTKSVEVGDSQQISVTTYKVGGVDQFVHISQTNNFKLALMVTLRMLAGNIFEQEQRRFRNMILPDPLSANVMFMYELKELFNFDFDSYDKKRKAIADIAFCPGNGDVIAVAYGIFSYGMRIPEVGYCCIWNIKNPVNPERVFSYNMAVVSVEFSAAMPQLLAIGLFDGTVEVRDIGKFDDLPIAITQRTESSTCDPISAIEWLPQTNPDGDDTIEIDPFLALSQDGSVTKYRVINSPYLLGFPQMQLDRVEGSPEGILIIRPWYRPLSNRCPQGVGMVLHPQHQDIYFLLTDEGCIHKCSTNYPHQHLEVLQVHNGAVNSMDFSPWSPKVFLTAGNDWHIRIWMEGLCDPLITLKNENTPVLCAAWSRTHSTVIISNTRKGISVWDIRRSILKPMSYNKTEMSVYTLFKFSLCGRSLAIGKERGHVAIVALEDFPFPPRFQYDELELAIYKALAMKPEIIYELKTIGFFGYEEHQHGRQQHCM